MTTVMDGLVRARERYTAEVDAILDRARDRGMSFEGALEDFERYSELRDKLAMIDERLAS